MPFQLLAGIASAFMLSILTVPQLAALLETKTILGCSARARQGSSRRTSRKWVRKFVLRYERPVSTEYVSRISMLERT